MRAPWSLKCSDCSKAIQPLPDRYTRYFTCWTCFRTKVMRANANVGNPPPTLREVKRRWVRANNDMRLASLFFKGFGSDARCGQLLLFDEASIVT